MDTQTVQYGAKWTVSALIVPIIGILLYLASVFGTYVLAAILGLIGVIFL